MKDVEQRLGTSLNLITKTLSKCLWHDANLVTHTILCWMLLTQNAQNRQLERLTMCLKSLRQSLECRLGTSLCQKHWSKTILSKLVIYSNFLNSTEKKPERQEGVHEYLSWWLRTSLWQRDRTQNCVRGDLDWDKCSGSCVENTSLTWIFCICQKWQIFQN